MDDQYTPSLVFADGYSYTEIFEAPETQGMPNKQSFRLFHALFTTDRSSAAIETGYRIAACPSRSEAALPEA